MTPISNLPNDVATRVRDELQSGERVTWAGQPMPGRFARRSIGMVLFAIPWTAFAVFWVAAASRFTAPDFSHPFDFFPLFGVPFILIGLGMLTSPFWMRLKARRTVYVITDRRAIILDGNLGRSTTVRSFEPARLGDIRRVQRPDGSGDLVFERTYSIDRRGGRHTTDHGFLAIENVKNVEGLIQQLVRSK